VRELVEAIGISHGRVINFVRTIEYKKAIGKMSRLLTVDHKLDRVTISKQCLEMFQRNPDEFLRRFITMDETWIHYFTSETKKQSKQWTSLSESASKKAKTVKLAEKMMATIFLGCMRYNSYRLSSVEANDQWQLLCNLIGSFQ